MKARLGCNCTAGSFAPIDHRYTIGCTLTKARDTLLPYLSKTAVAIYPMAITTVFINNRSQAIRLPDNVKRVDVRAVSNERVIAPVGQTWDSYFLGQEPLGEDFMPQRASQTQPPREDL